MIISDRHVILFSLVIPSFREPNIHTELWYHDDFYFIQVSPTNVTTTHLIVMIITIRRWSSSFPPLFLCYPVIIVFLAVKNSLFMIHDSWYDGGWTTGSTFSNGIHQDRTEKRRRTISCCGNDDDRISTAWSESVCDFLFLFLLTIHSFLLSSHRPPWIKWFPLLWYSSS